MISVAHSPDTDDYFLFWAIVNKRIDTEGLEFSFTAADTQKLNQWAKEARFDVIAVSAAVYPEIASEYLILPNGASIGRDYGPVVVAKNSFTTEQLNSLRVGVPGRSTTACLVFSNLAPEATLVELPIEPYGAMFTALEEDRVDALVLIHEGQLSYTEHGLQLIVDLGKWWNEKYQLPLPLGINVIKRAMGDEQVSRVSRVLERAIGYALEHTDELIDDLVELNKARSSDTKSEAEIRRYLGMYANRDSLVMEDDTRQAFEVLFAHQKSFKFHETSIFLAAGKQS